MTPTAYALTLRDALDAYLHRGEGCSTRVAVLTDPDGTDAAVVLVDHAPALSPHPVVCEALCAPVADVVRVEELTPAWVVWPDGLARAGVLRDPVADATDLICAAIAAGGSHV